MYIITNVKKLSIKLQNSKLPSSMLEEVLRLEGRRGEEEVMRGEEVATRVWWSCCRASWGELVALLRTGLVWGLATEVKGELGEKSGLEVVLKACWGDLLGEEAPLLMTPGEKILGAGVERRGGVKGLGTGLKELVVCGDRSRGLNMLVCGGRL